MYRSWNETITTVNFVILRARKAADVSACYSLAGRNCSELSRDCWHWSHGAPRLPIWRPPGLGQLVPRHAHGHTCRRKYVLGHAIYSRGRGRRGQSAEHRSSHSSRLWILSMRRQQRLQHRRRPHIAHRWLINHFFYLFYSLCARTQHVHNGKKL